MFSKEISDQSINNYFCDIKTLFLVPVPADKGNKCISVNGLKINSIFSTHSIYSKI